MKISQSQNGRFPGAFTLVELLVVIAVIGLLAAMIFPVGGAMKKTAIKRRVQAELAQLETAIERYKAKYGFYPPDNPGNPVSNQLYFELVGTTNLGGGNFQTLDGVARINTSALASVFGARVAGFVNCSAAGAGDDAPAAASFLTGLKPNQIAEFSPDVRLLVCSSKWPESHVYQPFANYPNLTGVNPWRYDSSSTNRHNLDSYDLWVDIFLGKQTNRISNWSRQPQIVSVP